MSDAVVLLSGGLDSATVLAILQREGLDCHALSFDYGQRHREELERARTIARSAGVSDHRIVTLDPEAFSGSALTDATVAVPTGRADSEIGTGVPPTYVPARNTIFLSHALALAEVLEASDIAIGANAVDYSGYPDCRPEYLEAFERMANLAIRAAVEGSRPIRIRAPLLHHTKAEIVRLGAELGVDHAQTTSCYDPAPEGACGVCDACTLRLRGFAEAGVSDPLRYRNR